MTDITMQDKYQTFQTVSFGAGSSKYMVRHPFLGANFIHIRIHMALNFIYIKKPSSISKRIFQFERRIICFSTEKL